MSTSPITLPVARPFPAEVVLSKTDASAEYGTDQKWYYAVLDADRMPREGMTGYERTKREAMAAARGDMRRSIGWF
ncbi:hypothetical protein SAMN04515671_2903 [Nakamurella panacisegetis]|uniref:Uncharacterized protein n=1 Tax=Nakamurella panacisegetis TaxID=1090615 RepID=A0A1H0PV42_9ACTN|nr:hypothetical protein [Nakamurella panacisegetis]SDP08535.1 hypothetical protein SAMN04515671_2903 [Nakamurella panacisegetis]